ncbi:uncharacterized protein LOC144647455 [Oculina patagonica]
MVSQLKHNILVTTLQLALLFSLERKVQAVPDPPVEVTAKPLNSTAVVIQWKEPKNPNSPVLNYYVEMLEETFQDMFLVSTSVTVGPSVSKLAIGKLRPFTNYIARVAVQTKAGKRFSDEVFFTTSESGTPEVQLDALFVGANQVLLKWNVVSRGSSVIQRYVIRYSLGRGSAWIKQVNISPSVTYYLLKNLFPSTTYYVELQASNTDFISAPSVVQVTTQKSEQDVELPKLPLPLPKRPSGFVYNSGKSSAPVHLSAFLDLTCGDSQQAWPVIKKLAKSYGPEKLRVTVNFFALAYFYHAFISLKSVYIVASYNSTLVFPWVDTVFEHRDYIKNSANSSQMSRMEIAEFIEQLADKAGIPSSVMRDGLSSWELEWQARLAWKYACSKLVMGTPTFYINDVFIAGDEAAKWNEEQWRGVINKVLPAE